MSEENQEDYTFDDFNDGSERLVGERHLEKMKEFLSNYSNQLKEIENAIDESFSEFWDPTAEPITINLQPLEHISIINLVRTDNTVFNKFMLAFGTLCAEMQRLREQAIEQFYGPLKLFGSCADETTEGEEGTAQLQMAKMLPFLLKLQKLVDRANLVVKNLIYQLANLYRNQQQIFKNFTNVHLQTVFAHLSDLFGCLITLDEIILSNEAFSNHLSMYKRMVKAIKGDPSRYNVSEDRLWQVDKLLLKLKGQLLEGRIFQNCIEQELDSPGVVEVTHNINLKKEILHNIKTLFQTLSTKIGDQAESNQRYKFMGLCGLYVFYQEQFKDPSDKKFFKQLWDMHKKVPILHLHSDVVWFPTEFFKKTIPDMVRVIGNPDVRAFMKDYVKQVDQLFLGKIQSLYLQISVWMARMESNLTNRADLQNILNTRIVLLTQGIVLAYRTGNLFKETVSLHLYLGVPIKTGHVRYLCQCIELLKAIQATFFRRSAMIGESISTMVQQVSFNIQESFLPIQNRLESLGKKYSDAHLDTLSAVKLAIQTLSGPATSERRLLLKLCMHIVFQMDFFKQEEIEETKKNLQKLDMLCDLQEMFNSACDCNFIFWSRSMLPTYFKDTYEHPEQAQKLQYMFAGLRDVLPLLNQIVHEDSSSIVEWFKLEIEQCFKTHILEPLCRDIETDLRLHIHSHLSVSERNPLKTGVRDLSKFLKLRPLRFFDRTIDIKAYTSHYLDTIFYNLTTVALHDWKTYGEMRNLAEEKYGLSLTEVHLPGQTLEQGIDILEIMRNIHIFVSRYNYNLNNQIFIERNSESKSLNTINIGHIANSIRTHGIGIMNTTVNFIYQFLREKFKIFSQFLYDDHIKSRLYRDIRFFRENKETLKNMYPFDRAQKFNKEIRKLGLTEQKESYLDQFRNLIIQIGNAMGFIRMIRSGGFSYVSNAIKFIPDLQEIVSFEELVSPENLSEETVESGRNLDSAIGSLAKNFAEGTEYFTMLVEVFTEEFRNPQNSHLKNFYVIVPPLTMNFVEHILLGKDKISKKKQGGFFTDDGFAMGVAYILKLLDQYKHFDSLHWFEQVKLKYDTEKEKVQSNINKNDKEEQQTAVLTLKKLRSYQMEFELLRFSFDGARIFFK